MGSTDGKPCRPPGLSSDPRALDNLTLGDLLVRYRDTVAIAKRSGPVETVILTAFLRHRLASVSLASLSPAHFSDYRDERSSQVEASTIIRELGLLQHALRPRNGIGPYRWRAIR